jgi:putative hemolysin
LLLELGIVAVLIVINGLLAMSELAVVSSRPARLAALVEKGVTGSRRALALASDPGKFLSTVQIGITLVGVRVSLPGLSLWDCHRASPTQSASVR